MLCQGAEQPCALSLAAGVLVRRFFLLALHLGVVAKAGSAILVGDSHVVNRLLDLRCKAFVVRMKHLEALAQEHPEGASAKLSEFLMEIVAVRRILLELNDGDTSARLLPVRAV